MDATAKQNRLLMEDNVRLHNECAERDRIIGSLVHTISDLVALNVKYHDIMVQKDKDIVSMSHLLAIYTNADSPSGSDPWFYEATKAFLAEVRAHKAAKKEADEVVEAAGEAENDAEVVVEECEESPKESPEEVKSKPCGGQPGHKGVSHHIRSSYTNVYAAEICDNCGRTDLELLPPINKLSVNFAKTNGEEEENMEPKEEDRKDAYTARVMFGWCSLCRWLIDTAPHLIWGTWLRGRALAATI